MEGLDRVIPTPRVLESDDVEIAARYTDVWQAVRHGELAQGPLIRALFALRTWPERWAGGAAMRPSICVDALRSSPAQPGFQLLVDAPPDELVVGAIGKVWQPHIPFVHVADAAAYAEFLEPGFIKVAWALQVTPLGPTRTRVTLEVRVDATDAAAWHAFVPYYVLIGPASRFIRHVALAALARQLAPSAEPRVALPGDERLSDAVEEITHEVTIQATPAAIWPWLVQLGCDRAGFYSLDALDNGGVRSAREIHREWQSLAVGEVIAASPGRQTHFEVLQVDEPHALVLGGLFDLERHSELPFNALRPPSHWHMTWAFVLQAQSDDTTRLLVRARVAFSSDARLHALWIRPVHHLMERAQLDHLRARAEGTLPRDDARDVLDGIGGALRIAWELVTPFGREKHRRWGVSAAESCGMFPGDELVPTPDWRWTHAIEINASASVVWPWLAQIGATRAGFYSYQWLENLVGCEVRNAESIHPDWEVRLGDALFIHPAAPPLKVSAIEPGRWFVAHIAADVAARMVGRPWVSVSWLFLVEPLSAAHCRVISRYRAACSNELATRLAYGPTLLRPIGFAMDRRMLIGLRERAERAARRPRR